MTPDDIIRPVEDSKEDLAKLVELLRRELGRLPTEDEVYRFIFADSITARNDIIKEAKRDNR